MCIDVPVGNPLVEQTTCTNALGSEGLDEWFDILGCGEVENETYSGVSLLVVESPEFQPGKVPDTFYNS